MPFRKAPSAPPPMPPSPGTPYDFIVNPGQAPKKSLLGGASSKSQRIIIAAAGGIVLLMILIIAVSLFSGAGSANRQDWLNLAQQQTELIRVSGLGVKDTNTTTAKNLAITTQLSLQSERSEVLKFAERAGADVSAKQLALGEDSKIDSRLTLAKQANHFDETFIEVMRSLLQKYRGQLKKVFDQSDSKEAKAVLQQAYNNAGLLIGGESAATDD